MAKGTHNVWLITAAIVCLLLGAMIYLLFRENIIFINLLKLNHVCHRHSLDESAFAYWFIYCFPDALWYISLILFQVVLSRYCESRCHVVWGITLALPFLLEFLQYLGIMQGTFDWWDVMTYLVIIILLLCLKIFFLFLSKF